MNKFNTLFRLASDAFYNIIQTSDDGFAAIGTSVYTGNGNEEIYVVRLDSAGNLLWQYDYGTQSNDQGYDLKQTNDGGFIISGFTTYLGLYDSYAIKTDSAGIVQWTNIFGNTGNEGVYGVITLSDNSYVMAGKCEANTMGSADILLVKYDSAGTKLWSYNYGAQGYEIAEFLEQTPDKGL